MVVDRTSRGKGKGKGNDKGKSNGKGKSKGKGTKPAIQRVLRVRRKRALRTRLLVTSKPRQNSQRGERCKVDSDAGKEFVFAVENAAKNVSPSHSGCEINEDGLVMIDSGASVGVCPKWFGASGVGRISSTPGCGGGALRGNGKRQQRKTSNLV